MATRLLTLILMLLIGHYAMATEEPTFEVLAETEDYEVRRYDAYIVAEVDVDGKSADNQGFRTLAGYIFGDNESSEKMQMTAPVESRDAGKSDEITYGFVMESKYTLETLPTPNNERIRLLERPSRIVAVRQFSGRWSQENITKHEESLLKALADDGISLTGDVELARYDPPFKPWFLRRNEVMVPIRWPANSP